MPFSKLLLPEIGTNLGGSPLSTDGDKLKEFLYRIKLFENFTEEELDEVIPLFRTRRYVKGQQIVEKGEPGDTLYIVGKGQLKVVLTEDYEKEVILSLLEEGDFFGEMAILEQKPRSAHVLALKAGVLYELNQEDFRNFILAKPHAMLNIISRLSERLRKSSMVISDLTLLDVYGRVARFLLELSEEGGEATEEGTLIKTPPSQQHMASRLGTSRETINRVINDFIRRGILKKNKRQLVITSPAKLHQELS